MLNRYKFELFCVIFFPVFAIIYVIITGYDEGVLLPNRNIENISFVCCLAFLISIFLQIIFHIVALLIIIKKDYKRIKMNRIMLLFLCVVYLIFLFTTASTVWMSKHEDQILFPSMSCLVLLYFIVFFKESRFMYKQKYPTEITLLDELHEI